MSLNSTATQVHTQGFELAHPSIYSILEYMKGLVLQNHDHMIFMTGVTLEYPGSFHGSLVLMVYRRSEDLNLTNKMLYNGKEMFGQKGIVPLR